jgi:RNA polymerase sigma factor (sigma-70 family)
MWKGTTFPEDLADEAINRIAQKMTQYEVLGEVINNIQSFALGVARYVYQEHLRYQNITVPLETDNIKIPVDNNEDEKLKLIRSNCFEHCMSKLPSEDREVITKYYQQLGKDSEARRELAVKLDISINNLRVRVLNIRQRLSKCIEKCVEKKIIN